MVVGAAGLLLMPASQRANLQTLLTRSAPTLSPRRVVVAPLTNHTGDSTLTGIGALAADWIAQGLMRTTQFEVVDPRTASVASRIVEHIPALFRDGNRAIAVAEETGSGTVLSGDLFREGDTLRVLIQIIDVATGQVVRTVGPVNGSANAPSRLVTSLGERVVAAVATAVDTMSRGFSAGLGVPPSYEAYNEVSRAWESFFRGDYEDTFARLDHASSLDTSYMAPLLMRAYVETRLDHWPAVDTLVRRLTAHQRTLTPAERAVLNGLRADLRGDLWGRLRAARELVDLTPASVEGYTLAASTALMVNRPRESLAILSKVDPDRGLLLIAPFYWESHTSALHRLGEHDGGAGKRTPGCATFSRSFLAPRESAAGPGSRGRREGRAAGAPATDPRRSLCLGCSPRVVLGVARAAGARPRGRCRAMAGDAGGGDPRRRCRHHVSRAGCWRGTYSMPRGNGKMPGGTTPRDWSSTPRNPVLLGRLGATAARMGDRAEALRLASRLTTISDPISFRESDVCPRSHHRSTRRPRCGGGAVAGGVDPGPVPSPLMAEITRMSTPTRPSRACGSSSRFRR